MWVFNLANLTETYMTDTNTYRRNGAAALGEGLPPALPLLLPPAGRGGPPHCRLPRPPASHRSTAAQTQ